ncbi:MULTISPECIES: hypothetical protein [unclassified Lysobacter]|uniref:hypothetical protein n=1 Tax=unclassified Lysobacter TaxID=2635362 RepID=UPI001BE5A266|nr:MULTISPECIES: hypothetical protein [unclassified Lysobacter]MBT2749383.1 hypothetical protein [Lysobacter sp. ISL-42]MBT2753653.1 hypothetical protein [Lysobacter sp. ISL-50]MBT2779251.1 hypothetical protein [Lysobacter sp. ISL-54]MBT2781963.1 hypothetical protein [Lysobacter sp. ISL-52]
MHIDYFRVVLSLALCLGLGVGAIYLLRSRFRGLSARVTRDLSLLESLQIDPRTAVHVLGYKGERLLLTTRDNAIHVTALRSVDDDATAASEPAPRDDAADTDIDATAANAAESHAGARAS